MKCTDKDRDHCQVEKMGCKGCYYEERKEHMDFIINGISWQINEASQEEIKTMQNNRKGSGEKEDIHELNNRYYGLTYADECKIYLDKDLPTQRKRRTLLHELTHCYLISYVTHEEKSYDEEMVADIVSNSHDIVHKICEDYFDRQEQ